MAVTLSVVVRWCLIWCDDDNNYTTGLRINANKFLGMRIRYTPTEGIVSRLGKQCHSTADHT